MAARSEKRHRRPSQTWEATFAEFAEFNTNHGRFPRKTATDPDEAWLGQWLDRQRGYGRTGKLADDRVMSLDTLGDWRRRWDRRWADQYELLAAFLSANNRFPTQGAADAAEEDSYIWLEQQRRAARAGSLAPDRQTQLDSLGTWHVTHGDKWDRVFADLTGFTGLRGRWPANNSPDSDERRLALWLTRQRQAARKGTLADRRRAGLDGLGDWVHTHSPPQQTIRPRQQGA